MGMFISYSHSTGLDAAMAVETALKDQGLDPWWFSKPLHPEQIDAMVDFALANCTRCVFVWSSNPPSPWTLCEIMSIRNHFRRRLPSGEAGEAIIIVKDVQRVPEGLRLPLFEHSEYIRYRQGERLDFTYLDSSVPGVKPLVAGNRAAPKFCDIMPDEVHIGKRILYGKILDRELPFNGRFCWVLLEDNGGNRYIQQPRPTFTHRRRWGSTIAYLGKNIQSIILVAVNETAHSFIVTQILKQSFAGVPAADWPGDYYELDRISFPPLQE